MAGSYLKWLIPGVMTVAGGTALALAMTSAPIATDLESRSIASLRATDADWATVRIDGRDAFLRGTATTQEMIDSALARVASVGGVRSVTSEVILAEFVSPFPFSATVSSGVTTLSGGYPDEAVHEALLSEAAGASDTTRLLSGAPDSGTFQAAARFGLQAISQFDEGEIRLADLSLSITGRAKSLESYAVLKTLRDTVPAGVELAALEVSPPIASPYVWTATFDGVRLTLAGNVPTEQLEARLRTAVPSNIAVSASLLLASGAPEAFESKTLELLETLLTLERGTVSVSDGTISLTGAPESAAIADAVIAAVTALGGMATLEPARVVDFTLSIEKSGDAIALAGFVPDAATRDRLGEIAGADVTALELGRGAPDRFASGLDFGLELLDHFREGRFELRGTRLSLGGRAASVADLRTIEARTAEGAPQGFTLVVGDIRPPVASPFTFTAVKAATGGIGLSGYVPDDATRAELLTKVAELTADSADPADGAPENFAFFAGKGLEVLALLDSGTLNFDGTNWSIEGVVDTPQKGFAADAAYSVAGLRTMGWTYVVRLPEMQVAAALPIITPYAWRAQRAADGSVSFTGFAPSEAFKAYLKARAGSGFDGTALGAGAPADFGASAVAGLDALLALDEGSLGLNGTRWTLSGTIADAATRDTIQSSLAGKVDATQWQIAIQARDSAPVVTPYLWSATKAANGLVDLAGYLPSEALQSFAAVRAINPGRDTTAIASGEPAGFADDVLAGLEALTHLTEGKAAFDGSRWVLTGTAASQQQGETAITALRGGSRSGSLWTSAITGYTPPPAIAQEPSSSEPPVSSEPPSQEPTPSSEPSSSEPQLSSLEQSSEPAPSSEPSSAEMSSELPAPAEPSSVEPSSEPSSAPVPAEPSSEPVPVKPSAEPSAEPSSEPSAEPSPPEEDRGLIVVDPLPSRFLFEAVKEGGQPIVLTGGVPADATAAYFGVIAGDVPTDRLVTQTGFPADFIASGTAGLNVLTQLPEGRLGFDGARWWLRGMVEQPTLRDTLTANIAALPNGGKWSVFIGVLSSLEICRDHVAELERRNAITFQSGSATLTEDSMPVIDQLAVDLNICPEASVHVEGHTDADGAEDLNLALSVARAEAVVEALIERNVNLERLYAEGYGESVPIATNDTRDGKAANRRIAFSIVEE
jgi:outer membrane protein OmpA-like peptidoglycan-associated protein